MRTLMTRAALRTYLAAGLIALMAGSAPAQSRQSSPQEALARKHYELAETYKAAGKHSEAVAEYLKAYELVPRPSLLFNAAQAHLLAGDLAAAIEHYARYLELEPAGPGSAIAREQIFRAAELTWKRDEHDAALRWHERYLELAPDGAHADEARARFFAAAELRWSRGQWAAALRWHARYLELAPDGAHADEARERFFAAAERHRDAGDVAEAMAGYERYLEIAPEGASAESARAHLARLRAGPERDPEPVEPQERAIPAAPVQVSAAVEPARASSVVWSAALHAAFDYKARGGAAVVGVGAGLGERVELRAAAVLGPTLGAYLGGALYLRHVGAVRPIVGAGVPVFFSDGARVGMRASLGVEWPALARIDLMAELAAEHYFNAEWNRDDTVLVPMLGVRARL